MKNSVEKNAKLYFYFMTYDYKVAKSNAGLSN